MKKTILLLCCILFAFSCSNKKAKTPAEYVNPFIGTDEHGHVFPGATLPFSLVQLSPDTDVQGWDWCSGYHASDNSIMGFSHTHLSGTGASDLGDILFMPSRAAQYVPGTKENPFSGYRSRFSHYFEKAEPGYYSVYLDDVKALVELTSTTHAGVQKYGFETNENHYVTIDLSHGIQDGPIECYISQVNDCTVEGYRRSSGWADDHTIFFYAQFSQPIDSMTSMIEGNIVIGGGTSKSLVSVLKFQDSLDPLQINVGLSYVDIEGAKENLEKEVGDSDFETIRKAAFITWNDALSVVKVDGDENKKEIFYTALYHSMIAPYIVSDVDGRYISSNRNVYEGSDPNYGLFSTWDTFRALHPLLTIVAPDMNKQFVNSLIRYYEQSGRLPVWDLNMRETFCMIGYHSIPIITDAFFKGEVSDPEKALEAMLRSATEDTYLGLGNYRSYKYMPFDLQSNSVSKALEFAYDDWCIAQVAKALGKDDIYKEYIVRAQYYKNHFDSNDMFMKGRDSKGRFRKDFTPTQHAVNGVNDFTEGNSWHYSFFVPQDVNTLIDMMGGDEKFVSHLDELFDSETIVEEGAVPDVSGLIGNYAHGNEPSHHSAYLYAYAGEQWKTAKRVSDICTIMYTTERNGLCGNEDCGQMSAWYVMSAMGFYEVTPGSCDYVLGTPQFDTVTINVGGDKEFRIVADNLSKSNIYISSATFNGEPYTKSYITHQMITSGGELVLKMQNTPNKEFGARIEDRPHSRISDMVQSSEDLFAGTIFDPFIEQEDRFFADSLVIYPKSESDNVDFLYTTDGLQPTSSSNVLSGDKIIIKDDCILSMIARSKEKGTISRTSVYKFYKGRLENANVVIPEPSDPYKGNGVQTLTDGLSGGTTFRSGGWVAWNGGNITISVEFPETRHISFVGVDMYSEIGAWISMPPYFDIEVETTDGKVIKNNVLLPEDRHVKASAMMCGSSFDVESKKLNIIFPENIFTMKDGSENKGWLFIDEIVVK